MITGEESEQNLQFSQKLITKLRFQRTIMLRLGSEEYDSLQLFLLQECDRMQLHKRTKYLAKTYFDTAVTQLPQINSANAPLYLLTSILLAVKFNQSRAVSDYVSVRDLVSVAEGRFQHGEFIQAELQMLKLLKFRLHFTSPYECGANCLAIASKYSNRRARLAKIEIIIDFALTLPSLILIPPEQLFLACFLMIFEGVLDKADLQLVMRDVKNGSIVGQIKREIERGLSEMGNGGQTQKT